MYLDSGAAACAKRLKDDEIKDKVKSKDQCLDGRNISFPSSLMIVTPMQLFVVS